jgi:hypothetical protein
LLVVAVVAGTTASFVALRAAFETGRRKVGDTSGLRANGQIVFSREGDDGRLHLFAAQPDGSGLRQITEGLTDDSDATVSPDGRTIAYVRASDESGLDIAMVPIEGGDVVELADGIFIDDPVWYRLDPARDRRPEGPSFPNTPRRRNASRKPELVSGWIHDRDRRGARRVSRVRGHHLVR